MASKKSWATQFKRLMRFYYLRIIRLKTSAHSIALGVALGVFIGALPIIPFQSVVVLTLAVIFRGNKIAAFFSTFYSNVFTLIPFYTLLFLIGNAVYPIEGVVLEWPDPADVTMEWLIQQGWGVFSLMMLGGVIFGIPTSLGMYFLTRRAVLLYRRRKALIQLQKRGQES